MEEVLGIYPAENKQPPGRSAADEFVTALTKRFRFGKTHEPEKESGHSSTREPIVEAESETQIHLPPPRPRSTRSLSSTERTREQPQPRPGNRARSKSRTRKRIKDLDIPPVPRPSSEVLYAHMPLPAVPPPPLPEPETETNKEPENPRAPSPAASELTLPPNYGIDIAEWAESVFPAPADLQSLRRASSRDSALIIEDPPRSSSSASFTLPLWPAASRTIDSGFYGHDCNEDDDGDDATLHLPDTLEELIGPIPELGETVEYDHSETDSVSTLTEAIQAKCRLQNAQSQEITRAQQLDREIAEYIRERREAERQGSFMHDRQSTTMGYMLEKQREQRRYAEEEGATEASWAE
jgi:hypothetical protein